MGSTTVRYMMQAMLSREYTLECTQQALVSDIVHFFLVQLYCSIKVYCSYSNVKQRKYTCIRVQSVRLLKKLYPQGRSQTSVYRSWIARR